MWRLGWVLRLCFRRFPEESFDGARDVTDRFTANWVEFQLRLVTGCIIHRIPTIICFRIDISLLHMKRLILNDSYAKQDTSCDHA